MLKIPVTAVMLLGVCKHTIEIHAWYKCSGLLYVLTVESIHYPCHILLQGTESEAGQWLMGNPISIYRSIGLEDRLETGQREKLLEINLKPHSGLP